jgi:hypothetical protein
MWRLLTSGGRFLSIASLPATLGSEAGNDLRLRHASVLPHHVRFSAGADGQLRVEAIGEAAVAIGGRKVQRGILGHGDELILGRLRFTLERAGAAAAPERDEPAAEGLRQRPARRTGAASGGSGSKPDGVFTLRDKTLRFTKQPTRRGLLDVDFAQLSGAWKAAIVLGLILFSAALLWGVSLLTGLMG